MLALTTIVTLFGLAAAAPAAAPADVALEPRASCPSWPGIDKVNQYICSVYSNTPQTSCILQKGSTWDQYIPLSCDSKWFATQDNFFTFYRCNMGLATGDECKDVPKA